MLCAASVTGQEKLRLEDLPPAVRRTLEAQNKGDPVKEITRESAGDRAIYAIELERDNAVNPRLRIAEDGTIIPPVVIAGDGLLFVPDSGLAPVNPLPRLTLEQLPDKVQNTARREALDREIVDIHREEKDGRSVYEIEFRADGPNPKIEIGADGTLLRGEEESKGWRGLFTGMRLQDTPPAVQATVRREAGGRRVTDVDAERENEATLYRVEIDDPETGRYRLEIDRDGRIVKDSRPGNR